LAARIEVVDHVDVAVGWMHFEPADLDGLVRSIHQQDGVFSDGELEVLLVWET